MQGHRLRVAAAGAVVLLAACQPVDDDPLGAPSPSPASAASMDLAEAVERADEPAREWHVDARPVEVLVDLDDGATTSVRVTYLAPGADRMLVVDVGAEEVAEQQTTLDTLGFSPVPEEALAEIPELPDDAIEPERAADAAADALDACGLDGVAEVLWVTGAPGAWDGEAWAGEPQWRATLRDDDGAGVMLEADGRPREDACVEAE